MMISSPGPLYIVSSVPVTDSERWATFLFKLTRHVSHIFNRFQVVLSFGGFGEQFGKHLLRGHFLASDRIVSTTEHENRFTSLGCTRGEEIEKSNRPRVCRPHLK